MKLTLTQAYNDDKKKDGSPILGKNGQQKYRARIKTVEKGDEWLTGFVFKPLNKGDVIEAEVKSGIYNNAPQLTFDIVTKPQSAAPAYMPEVLSEMKNHTVFLKNILSEIQRIGMSISTHQTIQAIKGPTYTSGATTDAAVGDFMTEGTPVLSEDDYGDPFGFDLPDADNSQD